MTPAARVQTAIELLDAIIQAAREGGASADRIVAEGFRQRRYAGSKDRRAIRELVYGAIRACGPIPESGRAAMLRLGQSDPAIPAFFDGTPYGPAQIVPGEAVAAGSIAPEWLMQALAQSGTMEADAQALLTRAPLDIRVNTLKADRGTLELPANAEILPTPAGLRLPHGTQIEEWPQFRDGLIEIQDCGSQIACLAADAKPGEIVIDLCAGAGGKTLSLAAAMDDRGLLIASDTDRGRLSRLAPRAQRAGVAIVESVLLNPGRELIALDPWVGKADLVVIDAPCSGTGTWRRNPEARWRLTERQLARYVEAQSYLLELAPALVRPGGCIVYVTCSLLDVEGPDRIEDFLARHADWQAQPLTLPLSSPLGRPCGGGMRLTPADDGTDGFFIARLSRPC